MTEENLGLHRLAEGLISASWSSSEAVSSKETLFTLLFQATEDGLLSEALQISSEITRAEAYRSDALSIESVSLNFRTDDGIIQSDPFALYQNQPNPFSNETLIGFVLPEAGQASLTIYDVAGKVLKVIDGEFTKGYNEVSLNRNDIPAAGTLYYQLDAGEHSATKKMIIVK